MNDISIFNFNPPFNILLMTHDANDGAISCFRSQFLSLNKFPHTEIWETDKTKMLHQYKTLKQKFAIIILVCHGDEFGNIEVKPNIETWKKYDHKNEVDMTDSIFIIASCYSGIPKNMIYNLHNKNALYCISSKIGKSLNAKLGGRAIAKLCNNICGSPVVLTDNIIWQIFNNSNSEYENLFDFWEYSGNATRRFPLFISYLYQLSNKYMPEINFVKKIISKNNILRKVIFKYLAKSSDVISLVKSSKILAIETRLKDDYANEIHNFK